MVTRKARAQALLRRLNQGPAWTIKAFGIEGVYMTPAQREIVETQVKRSLRIWLDNWVMQDVRDLIPELRVRENVSKD